ILLEETTGCTRDQALSTLRKTGWDSLKAIQELTPAPVPAEKTGKGECVVCLSAPAAVACVPCGHVPFCLDCEREAFATERYCPVCRKYIAKYMRLFYP